MVPRPRLDDDGFGVDSPLDPGDADEGPGLGSSIFMAADKADDEVDGVANGSDLIATGW